MRACHVLDVFCLWASGADSNKFEQELHRLGPFADDLVRPRTHLVPHPGEAREVIQPMIVQVFHHDGDLDDVGCLSLWRHGRLISCLPAPRPPLWPS